MVVKICANCGKHFRTTNATKFCSTLCRVKYQSSVRPKRRKDAYETICWTCQNATGGCSWSRNLTPVDGWKAEIKKIKNTNKLGTTYADSYKVISCPEYIEDEPKGGIE